MLAGKVIFRSLVFLKELPPRDVRELGNVIASRFEAPFMAQLSNLATLVKLTNSLNLVIFVLYLNTVPMESHRDCIPRQHRDYSVQ